MGRISCNGLYYFSRPVLRSDVSPRGSNRTDREVQRGKCELTVDSLYPESSRKDAEALRSPKISILCDLGGFARD